MSPALRRAEAFGIGAGFALDAIVGDPRRFHPVAAFGRAADTLEQRLWRDATGAGVAYAALIVGAAAGGALAAARSCGTPARRAWLTAFATWAVVGGTTLRREAAAVGAAVSAGELAAARARLPALCGRDPHALDAPGLLRATVESVAENTSDAAVAPAVWGALAGVPGLLVFRAVNTLDAMVGHRTARYRRFGTAAARLDDVACWLPARVTCTLAVALAPLVGGSPREAARAWRRDGAAHESPNAGVVEAAFAGALGVRLGGPVRYAESIADRRWIGGEEQVSPAALVRALRLSHAVVAAAAVLSVAVRALLPARRGER